MGSSESVEKPIESEFFTSLDRKQREGQQDRQWIVSLLTALRQERFFGQVEIVMESGRIIKVRKTQTLLPGQD